MSPLAPHPADPLLVDLESVYAAAGQRISSALESALRRGLTLESGTAVYLDTQRRLILAAIDDLSGAPLSRAGVAIARGYEGGLRAVDATTGTGAVGKLAPVHSRAVELAAQNLTASLEDAIIRTKARTEDVFAIARELTGGLPADRSALAGGRFLGRRVDDSFRAATLRSIAEGLAGASSRREISGALVERLVTNGVTDAVTGFVTSNGARIPLDVYSRMAVRTTTREAMSAGAANRMVENGIARVEISVTPNPAPECQVWEGQVWPIDEVELPPYHPNCEHVATPAGVNLDDYEAELDAFFTEVGPA